VTDIRSTRDTTGAVGRVVAVVASAAAVIATVVALGVSSDSGSTGPRISEQVVRISPASASPHAATPAPSSSSSSTASTASTPPGLRTRVHRAQHRCTVATARELHLIQRTYGTNLPSRAAAKALLRQKLGLSGHPLARALAAVGYLAANRASGAKHPLALAIGRSCIE